MTWTETGRGKHLRVFPSATCVAGYDVGAVAVKLSFFQYAVLQIIDSCLRTLIRMNSFSMIAENAIDSHDISGLYVLRIRVGLP